MVMSQSVLRWFHSCVKCGCPFTIIQFNRTHRNTFRCGWVDTKQTKQYYTMGYCAVLPTRYTLQIYSKYKYEIILLLYIIISIRLTVAIGLDFRRFLDIGSLCTPVFFCVRCKMPINHIQSIFVRYALDGRCFCYSFTLGYRTRALLFCLRLYSKLRSAYVYGLHHSSSRV